MPRQDGRGPEGYGPMTGRGQGLCGDRGRKVYPARRSYEAGYQPGYGPGRGAGYRRVAVGGFGPGFGEGYRAGFGAGFGAGPGKRFVGGRRGGYGRFAGRGYAYNKYDGETEQERLTRHKSYLEKKLDIINKRLEEL